ncbi:unnamed protein product, partial [Staurois parvus]
YIWGISVSYSGHLGGYLYCSWARLGDIKYFPGIFGEISVLSLAFGGYQYCSWHLWDNLYCLWHLGLSVLVLTFGGIICTVLAFGGYQ